MPHDLFDELDAEWRHLAAGARASATLEAWARIEPALDGHGDLAELVVYAQRAGDYATTDSILLALARLARSDQLAGRVLLQAILPGLRAVARRRRGLAARDDLSAAVMAAAWEQIRRYPTQRRPRRVAANLVLDTRQRLERTRTSWQDPGHEELPREERRLLQPVESSAAELLADLLADAVDAGDLRAGDAHIIWRTRCLAIRTEEVARSLDLDERNARQRRTRAERRLRLSA